MDRPMWLFLVVDSLVPFSQAHLVGAPDDDEARVHIHDERDMDEALPDPANFHGEERIPPGAFTDFGGNLGVLDIVVSFSQRRVSAMLGAIQFEAFI